MLIRVALLLTIATSLSMSSGLAQGLSDERTAKIEKIVSRLMTERGAPGLSVAISTGNQLCYTQGFGLADVENSVAATSETKFRTASIAKPMTAALVMSYVQSGKIDLDADVRQYCPQFLEKQWSVTTRQLLGHLGGVRHYKNEQETRSTEHFFSLESALETFRHDPLKHQPGSKFLYSSFGYNLLGSVVEAASGYPFYTQLQDHVLSPAGMTSTVVDDQLAVIPNRARGYMRATPAFLAELPAEHGLVAGELYNAALHDTSVKIPGGGLLSTSSDLVRFAIAMNTGQLLSEATRKEMWIVQTTVDGMETGYGLGWRVERRYGRHMVSHTGGQAGTSTVLILFPDSGTSVAIMCNLQSLRLTDAALAIAQLAEPELQPTTDYSPALEKLKAAIGYEVEAKQLPAFSMALVDEQQNIWSAGFGFQDADKKIPATAESVYRVGSVSKLFTDIAVMQLVEDGRLDLDVPVQSYLPAFAPTNPFDVPITLRQLMSHRSGLVRESPVGNYFDPTEPSLSATVASLNQTRLVYKPETRTKYSNAAVSVVGSVLESQMDVSHPERVRQTILSPLGMNNSSFFVDPRLQPRLATGWMWTCDGRRFIAPTFLLGTGPAGNMYSSVNDLAKFLSCLLGEGQTADGQILRPDTLKTMMAPIKTADGKTESFGLGFHVQDLDGFRKIGHGGAVYGFSTQVEALPERKLGVAAASSLDGSNGVVSRLADYALRLMIASQDGKPLPAYRMTRSLPAERAAELVGSYREPDGVRRVHISEMNGQVFMHRGSFRYELRSAADDGAILTDDAHSFGIEVKLNDGKLLVADETLERLENNPPADIPSRWKGLIGEYGWDHNTLYILEQDGQLFALIEWFYYYPLKAVDDSVFEFPDYGLYHGEALKFTRDEHGVASEVNAAEVRFVRREVGTKDGETFKIKPLRPIGQLRDAALAAAPPTETGDFREADLIELVAIDSTIQLDIRYATTNNFTGEVFYRQPRAFMQRDAAEAVARANQRLKSRGLGLLVHDAYRPWHVTKMFWDATPDEMKDFVANPANGSRHNRGCAVDITLYDLNSGQPIQMVAGYDEFSPRSFPLYPGGTSNQRWHRELLRRTMEAEGFTIYEYEWWHFDFRDWKKYRIGNVTFEQVLQH